MTDRILVCVPQGGLNDMFNQISLCVDYCARYARTLYIHTENAIFGEIFGRYFRYSGDRPVVVVGEPERFLSCLPFDIDDFMYSESAEAFVSRSDHRILRLDFERDADQEFLLHHACGGGDKGKHFLRDFELVPEFREIVLGRAASLTEPYVGIHIRNTDYQTDYVPFLSQVQKANKNSLPIYLATDSREVLDFAKSIGMEYFNFSNVPSVNVSLHTTDKVAKFDAIIDQISDLYILGRSGQLILSKMKQGSYSGFSVLAAQCQSILKAGGSVLGMSS